MESNEGDAPKKVIDLAKLMGDGSAVEQLREQMERNGVLTGGSASERLLKETDRMDALTGSSRALQKALAPSTAIQKMMKPHEAAFEVSRILPNFRELTGIASLSEINALKGIHVADVGPVPRNLTSHLNFMQSESITRMLDNSRAGQTAFRSAISDYSNNNLANSERISNIIRSLSIPRIDVSNFGISSALALSETDAFKIAGLTTDYTEQFRSITSALNEQFGSFAGIPSGHRTFGLQPYLVEGIGSLIERALAQQEYLLEQLIPKTEAQPRQQTLIAEKLTILNAIVSLLFIILSVCVMLEEHLAGGDAATLKNTMAIEENTRTIETMRGSFDSLADQLEQITAAEIEANEEEITTNADIAEILREIAATLIEQERGQGDAHEGPD